MKPNPQTLAMPIESTSIPWVNPEATRAVLEDSDPISSAKPAPLFTLTELGAVFGCLASPTGPLSIEAMDEAVLRAAETSMSNFG